jgi:Flp pilus assembly protein TadD
MKRINRTKHYAAKNLQRLSALLMLLSLSYCAQITPPLAVNDVATAAEQTAIAAPLTAAVAIEPDAKLAPMKPKLAADLLPPFQQAKQLMRAGDYQAAILLLAPLTQAAPDAAGIRYNLALCYWQLQQTEQARQQLNQVLERQPAYVEAANLLGVIARNAGQFNQARQHWLGAIALQRDFASAHKNLAFLYDLYLAQPEQARYHYQQYQRLSADPMAEAWLSLLDQQQE